MSAGSLDECQTLTPKDSNPVHAAPAVLTMKQKAMTQRGCPSIEVIGLSSFLAVYISTLPIITCLVLLVLGLRCV